MTRPETGEALKPTSSDWDEDAAERRYMDDARKEPAIRQWRKIRLMTLGFHLWCMTPDELAAATVDDMRERKKLLHGYITDDEIAAEISAARNRTFHPLPDSTPFMGASSNWHTAHRANPTNHPAMGRGA